MNNLNQKTIIQIVVIVVAFGGSAYVLYNGMFKKPATPSGFVEPVFETATNEKILPYGESLDLSNALNRQNLRYGTITYPKLDPNIEVGKDARDMIVAATKATP